MLISVVVPFHQYNSLTERCINSIIPQLTQQHELILIGDGVHEDLCSRINLQYPQLKVIPIPKSGANTARQEGVEKASGCYIFMADSDDELEQDALITYSNIIEKESPDLIMGNVKRIKHSDHRSETVYHYLRPDKNIKKEELYLRELYRLPVLICKCIRKECFKHITFDNSSMFQDINITAKIFKNIQTIYYTNQITYIYHTRAQSTSSQYANTPQNIMNALPSINGITSFYHQKDLSPIEHRYLSLLIIRFFFTLTQRALPTKNNHLCILLHEEYCKHMHPKILFRTLCIPKAFLMGFILYYKYLFIGYCIYKRLFLSKKS